MHLIAAGQWREYGKSVPATFSEAERVRAILTTATLFLLERVRVILSGPIVLIKVPGLAARYPTPTLRPFGDLDLRVADAQLSQRQLLKSGFISVDDELRHRSMHHGSPLVLRSLPLALEIHGSLGWLP